MPPKCKPDKTDAIAGANIRAERERLVWTRAKLGEIVKLTPVTIYKYESGRTRIPLANFVDICQALGKSPGVLLRGLF